MITSVASKCQEFKVGMHVFQPFYEMILKTSNFVLFFSSTVPGVQGSLIKHFIGQWLYDTDCFNGLHDRKLCVLGLCQVQFDEFLKSHFIDLFFDLKVKFIHN